ncbi:MAG: glycogen synthase GlgA [Nitrospirae bacterium]|nr:glycogen synthase GlgA [Nitrospirota bacterium]
MKILVVSSEAMPFVKTGGLADVAGTLVDEYKKLRHGAALFLPLYRKIKQSAMDFGIKPLGKEITVPLAGIPEKGMLWKGKTPQGTTVYFIENDKFYDRDELYGTPAGDFPDNASRFVFFDRGVLEALRALNLNFDVIHCNDWQTCLIPVYIKTLYKEYFPKTKTILTIHNMGYQGQFSPDNMPLTGLGWKLFNMEALEFYGKINLLKGGIVFADALTTVSGNYAKEILTKEYGFGLEGVLKKRSKDIYGILNGIDYKEWNPEKDSLIPASYTAKNLKGKARCKTELQKACGFIEDDSFLIGIVSRLSAQKGLDLVAKAIDDIINLGAQVAVLGKGDESFQHMFSDLQKKYRGRVSFSMGFNDSLAHKIYAGSDAFLMPSRYEPCGLGQLIALRYGTIPIARKTGGIINTVTQYNIDKGTGTGFLFGGYSADKLLEAVKQAAALFKDKKQWQKICKNAMSEDFSWQESAKRYISLYKKLKEKDKVIYSHAG